MTKRKKSERSEAQVIADKHNGNCYCLEGAVANLRRIIYECENATVDNVILSLDSNLGTIQARLRRLIERQYEYEKDKAGKSTPKRLVGNKRT